MVFKRKLPLAVVISMSTMLTLHVLMPINLHQDDSSTSQEKRAVVVRQQLEACPEDGDLLPEDAPYWSEKIDVYKKPKYDLAFVGDKPVSDVCCAPDNATKKSYGYVEPPQFTDKCKNPCWYDGTRLRCMPYFYIIGVTKSATTDLLKRLLQHPDIRSPRKDIHWFSRLRTLGAGLRWYTGLFNGVAKDINSKIKEGGNPNTVIGEGSLDYLSDVHVWPHFTGNQGCHEPRITIASHLRHVNPNAKIIVCLREPARRIYSTYLYTAAAKERLKDPSTQKLHENVQRAVMAYKECLKNKPVRVCIYNRTLSKLHPIDIASGAYATFVEEWLKTFPKEQVYVVKFEDYGQDMAGVVKDVVQFLQLPPFSDSDYNKMKAMPKHMHNVYYRMGPMQNRSIKLLKDFYGPFNMRLSKMLGDDRFLWK